MEICQKVPRFRLNIWKPLLNFIIQQGALLGTFNTCFQMPILKFFWMLWRQCTFLMNFSKGGKHTKSKYSCLSLLTSQIHIFFLLHMASPCPDTNFFLFIFLGAFSWGAVHWLSCEGLLFDWNAFLWCDWVEYHHHVSSIYSLSPFKSCIIELNIIIT